MVLIMVFCLLYWCLFHRFSLLLTCYWWLEGAFFPRFRCFSQILYFINLYKIKIKKIEEKKIVRIFFKMKQKTFQNFYEEKKKKQYLVPRSPIFPIMLFTFCCHGFERLQEQKDFPRSHHIFFFLNSSLLQGFILGFTCVCLGQFCICEDQG